MSGFREIEAAVSPASVIVDGSAQLLVRVQIVDLDDADVSASAFIDLPSTEARRIALEILAAADDADWQTDQDGCEGGGTISARARTTAAAPPKPGTPAPARALACQLAALFAEDQQIVLRLNAAHDRLAAANDRLWIDPVLPPLGGVHQEIHSAFSAYQDASEERRQLAVNVGELTAWLTDALTAAGHSREQARSANVHELAAGTWQPPASQDRER